MPFSTSSLSLLARGRDCTLWRYETTDDPTDLFESAYFSPAAGVLRRGDLVFCVRAMPEDRRTFVLLVAAAFDGRVLVEPLQAPAAEPLAGLAGVEIAGPAAGDVLTFTGGAWANRPGEGRIGDAFAAAHGSAGSTAHPLATATAAGFMAPADKAKLDGVEAGATADQSGAEMVKAIDAALASADWRQGVGGKDAKLAVVDLLAQRGGFDRAEAEAKALIAASPDEHAYAFKLASLYVNNARAADAEAVLRKIVAEDGEGPSGMEARVNLARQAAARGDRAGAEAMLKEVLALEPENGGAILVRGTMALQANDVDGALADARTVLRTQPRSTEALRLLAETQLRRQEPHLAIETLTQLVQVEPDNDAAREQLGRLHLSRGELDQALTQFEAVLAKTPDRFESLLPMAQVLIAKRRFAEAEAVVEKVSALPDRAPTARLLAGRLKLAQGALDPAIREFRAAEELTPQADEPVVAIVQSYVAANRSDEALAYLDGVIARRPDDAFVLNLKGETLARRSLIDEALEALRAAIAARPDWEVPYANLGSLLVSAGRGNEGVAAYRQGLGRLPDNPRLLYQLGSAQELLGDGEGALATYETLLAKEPGSDVAANNYAALVADFAYGDAGMLARAFDLAKRFETSNEPFYLDTLGWVHYRRGDFAQARIYLDRAVRLRPDVPVIQYHLGMALYRLGDKEAARAALQAAVSGDGAYTGKDEATTILATLSQS